MRFCFFRVAIKAIQLGRALVGMLVSSLAGKLIVIGIVGAAIDVHPYIAAAILFAITAYGAMRS